MERRLHKRIKRFLRYLVLRAVYGLLSLVPLRVSRAIGAWLGRMAFTLAKKQRRLALASLAVAFPELPEAERVSLARRNFEHLGVCAGEIFCLSQITPTLDRYVELAPRDEAILRAAAEEKRGVLFVTGHVGNFELMARRIGSLGYPAYTIAKPPSDPRLTAYLDRVRASGNVRTIWRGRGTAVQEMTRALAEGGLVGLLIDQDTRGRGVFVDFFGRSAYTPRIVGDLALQTGAAVVTGFVFRRPDGGHRVVIERVPVERTGSDDADSLALNQTLTRAIEGAVRQSPEEWVWIHQRWKTRPPTTPSAAEPKKSPLASVA